MLEVDSRAKRISLGLKQLEPDPWTLFTDKYKPGDKIGGKVRSLTDYGVFVGIEEGVDGMVHKTDLSWTVKINNPGDFYGKGDDVEAIILSINHDEKKVSLGVKQLCDDPWADRGRASSSRARWSKTSRCSASPTTARSCASPKASRRIIPPAKFRPASTLKVGDKIRAEVSNIDAMDRRITHDHAQRRREPSRPSSWRRSSASSRARARRSATC